MLGTGQIRYNGKMVYDAADGYVLLFGGTNISEAPTGNMADTWEYSAGAWKPVITATAPAPRWAEGMAYDAADGCVVLFGGFNGIRLFNDTWTFAGGRWTDLNLTSAPGGRAGISMEYDPGLGYVLLFGGYGCSFGTICTPGLQQDTWTFVGGQWTELSLTTSPNPRDFAAMTYDGADAYMVLFGGEKGTCTNSCNYYLLQDTWVFEGGAWTNLSLAPGSSPGVRIMASMAYDSADGYVMLFGGNGCNTGSSCPMSPLQDTWKFLLGAWTQLSPATFPGIRFGAMMAYDPADGYVVLFGGGGCSYGPTCNGNLLQDTWTYAGGAWSIAASPNLPGSRWGAAMAYDPKDGYVVLFGGYGCGTGATCTTEAYLQDTWTFAGGEWSQLSTANSPGTRYFASMEYDPVDGYVVLFGGYGCSTGSGCAVGYLQDTWTFLGGAWSELTPVTSPGTRVHAMFTYDGKDGYLLLFGGLGCSTGSGCTAGNLQDTWGFVGGDWTQLTPSTYPGIRESGMIAYDEADGYVVLFGGSGCSTGNTCTAVFLQDTWMFKAGTWTEMEAAEYGPKTLGTECFLYSSGTNTSTVTPCPTVRTTRAMSYDAKDGYVALFGGANIGGYVQDTWDFVGGIWAELASTTSPGVRTGAGMVYDSASGSEVLFGGIGCNTGSSCTAVLLQDTWEFVAGEWTEPSTAATPGVRGDAMMVYDLSDGYVLLFGGLGCSIGSTCSHSILQDTWKFAGGQWTQLFPSTSPGVRQDAMMVYDVANGYVLLFGGYGCSTGSGCTVGYLQDTWTFVGGQWSQLSPTVSPGTRENAVMVYDAGDTYVLLSGGWGCSTGSGCTATMLSDTWTFLNGAWTSITPSTYPGARDDAQAAYDPADGYVVLFGGFGCVTGATCGAANYLQDTWTFAAGTWTQLSPLKSPAGRYQAVMAYDAADGYVLLFSGELSTGMAQDTWEFSAGEWTRITPADFPGVRYTTAMTYDEADGYIVMFGGNGCSIGTNCPGTASLLSDTWSFGIPLVDKSPDVSARYVDLGQSVTFTASAIGGGSGQYSFGWPGLPAGCYTGVLITTVTCTPTQTGILLITTVVADSANMLTTTSMYNLLVVNTALVAPSTPTVNETTLDANQTLTAQSTLSYSGTPLYNWTWLVSVNGGPYVATTQCAINSGTGARPSIQENCSIAPNTLTGGDTYNFELQESDGAGVAEVATSAASPTVTVSPMLSAAAPTPATPTIDVGQTLLVTNAAAGGTSPLSWQWYDPASSGQCSSSSPAISGATSATYTTPATLAVGTYYYCYMVSDSSGAGKVTLYSSTNTITVVAGPTVKVTPAGPLTYSEGQAAGTLTATVTYTGSNKVPVEWFSNTTASCNSGSADTRTSGTAFVPPTTSAGTTYYCAVVSDANVTGYTSASNVVEVTVSSTSTLPTITIFTANPSTVVVGSWTNFTVSASGGTGTLSYAYTGLPNGCASANIAVLACRPLSAATYNVSVTVTDQASHTASKTTKLTVTQVPGGPTISAFAANPSSVNVGSTTTLTVTVTGGTGTLTYAYTGLPGGCKTQDASSLSCTPTAAGNFVMGVYVNDSAGHSTTATTSLTVTQSSPSSNSSSWTTLLIIIVVVVVVVVVALVLVLMSRRKKGPAAQPQGSVPASGPQPPSQTQPGPVQEGGTPPAPPPPPPTEPVSTAVGPAPAAPGVEPSPTPVSDPVYPTPSSVPPPSPQLANMRPCPYCGTQNQRESSTCQKCSKTLPPPL
jgi:hypothetical protein